MKNDRSLPIFSVGENILTYGDIVDALFKVDADKYDILFVHSDISFGLPVPGIKRSRLNELLVDALQELNVKTLMFPTFTFSFCNNQDYNIQESKTTMGMLPEYVRKREDAYRTNDPMLSVAIIGDKSGFEKMDGVSSCGNGGIFHQLRNCGKKVGFVFFGTLASKCFTYLHYVEEMHHVPYRYDREFSGKVIDDGIVTDVSVNLYVRYKDVIATGPEGFEDLLIDNGVMKKTPLGNSFVSVVSEKHGYDFIEELLENNPHVFYIDPPDGKWVKEFSFGNVTTM